MKKIKEMTMFVLLVAIVVPMLMLMVEVSSYQPDVISQSDGGEVVSALFVPGGFGSSSATTVTTTTHVFIIKRSVSVSIGEMATIREYSTRTEVCFQHGCYGYY